MKDMARVNPADFVHGKKTDFRGIGLPALEKFVQRAKLQISSGARPILRDRLTLPDHDLELFFDIEVDPMRDICYLHGFVERRGRDKEHYIPFFADDPAAEAEERAFTESWRYLSSRRPCAIYYYSKYERTIYRRLQSKYPGVCTPEQIEELFDPADAVDLYSDVVKRQTEWPTRDYSIKTLAKFLGFNWRDKQPSGAASIEWFDRWVKTRDPEVKQRILDYNEDDCIATRVLLDGLRRMAAPAGSS